MPLEHPDFLKDNPYNDDFSDEKDFLRILFKPGYGIQARELTQLQTILQNQTSRFADHIFKEGSKIFGGNVNTTKVTYIRIEKNRIIPTADNFSFIDSLSDTYLETLKSNTESEYISNDTNSTYVGSISHIELEVFNPDENGNYDYTNIDTTLRLIHYLKSGYSENDDFTILFANSVSSSVSLQSNSVIKVKDQDVWFKIIETDNIPNTSINEIEAFGSANLISVDSGIYYTNGMFVRNNRQHICPFYNSLKNQTEITLVNNILYTGAPADVRLFTFSSSRIGFYIDKSIIDISEDPSLADPASGFYNQNAPGADRYKINLILSALPYEDTSVEVDNFATKDFIQLVKITRGNVDWIRKLTNYSEILDLIARRTYDESGSYTVRPFTSEVKNHLRRDVFELLVQNSPEDENEDSFLEIGGYVWATTDVNGNPVSTPTDFPFDISDFSLFNYSVGVIIDVVPYKEGDVNLSDTAESFTKKIKVQPVNKIRFLFDTQSFQTFNYKKSPIGSITNINVKYLKFITDSDGVYSVYDTPKGDTNKAVVSVQPGKAYVYGYEYDFYGNKNIEYLKGRNQDTNLKTQVTNLNSSSFLGNYVIGNFESIDTNIINTNIDWEKLPRFELQSDETFTLIMERGELIQAEGLVNSWSPFPTGQEQTDYESVLLISDTSTP